MEVVEDEDHRLGRRQPFEQLTHGAIGPVALVLQPDRSAAAEVGERREHMRELDPNLRVEVVESSRLDAFDVFVERIDEDPEGEVTFEVGTRAAQNDVPAGVSARGQLAQESGLPDPSRPDDLNRACAANCQLVQSVVQLLKFGTAPYEVVGEHSDRRPRRDYTRAGAAERVRRVAGRGSQIRAAP